MAGGESALVIDLTARGRMSVEHISVPGANAGEEAVRSQDMRSVVSLWVG